MDNPIRIQKQIKDNVEDLQKFVKDLKLWEEEMKRKDQQLSGGQSNEEAIPPVRRAKLSDKTPPESGPSIDDTKKRIPSSDYKSWDKFDADKACEDIDKEETKKEEEKKDSAEQNEKYMKEKALYEKELGNKHVEAGNLDAAIEAYTKAISAYSRDPTFYANRALCYFKKKNWEAVDRDCIESLKLDSTYVKAYLRRAVAREALGRVEGAKRDLREVLRLEPRNTQAYRNLHRLRELGVKKKDNKLPEDNPTVIRYAYGKSVTVPKSEKDSLNEEVSTSGLKIKDILKQEPSTSGLTIKDILKQEPSTSGLKIKDSLNQPTSTSGLKAKVDSEPNWRQCKNTIQPISKPPHLRSKKRLKRIEIHDFGLNAPKHVCLKNQPKQQKVLIASTATGPTMEAKPTSPKQKDVPPLPKTSVQFYQSWSTIKDDRHLCYQYLKQIPGTYLSDLFKDSLESRMFSNIIETLASECDSDEHPQPVLCHLQGLTLVRRFSTLVLFLSSSDKSNLTKLFDHCLSRGVCSPTEISRLQRLYEM